VVFQDDNILSDKERFIEILKDMKELELFPFFQNGLSMYLLDDEILNLLKEIGTEEIVLPIESGSEKTLKYIMRKPLNREIIRRVVQNCKNLGLYTSANILVGLPGETKADIEDSLAFLKTLPVNWFHIFNFSPLVGSFLHKVCLEKKYIDKNVCYLDDYKTPTVNTKDFDVKYIKDKMYSMNLELNFINNSDFANGDYEKFLIGLKNVIRVKPNHALAHYYMYLCYANLDHVSIANSHLYACKLFKDDFWDKIFTKYEICV
jgi:radical SAM superfamily enzyme YgiQ (UPF0313 family)